MQEKYLILIYLWYILYLEKLGKNSQSECLVLWQDTNNMSDWHAWSVSLQDLIDSKSEILISIKLCLDWSQSWNNLLDKTSNFLKIILKLLDGRMNSKLENKELSCFKLWDGFFKIKLNVFFH